MHIWQKLGAHIMVIVRILYDNHLSLLTTAARFLIAYLWFGLARIDKNTFYLYALSSIHRIEAAGQVLRFLLLCTFLQ